MSCPLLPRFKRGAGKSDQKMDMRGGRNTEEACGKAGHARSGQPSISAICATPIAGLTVGKPRRAQQEQTPLQVSGAEGT